MSDNVIIVISICITICFSVLMICKYCALKYKISMDKTILLKLKEWLYYIEENHGYTSEYRTHLKDVIKKINDLESDKE